MLLLMKISWLPLSRETAAKGFPVRTLDPARIDLPQAAFVEEGEGMIRMRQAARSIPYHSSS